jgi:glycosyltransferase involved in cell wall biosynthesis
MSTYNGEKYLAEQLDSILGQDCEKKGLAAVQLLVRDDGSTDGTQRILQEYAKRYPEKIQWFQGKNCGVIQSFFALLQKAPDADYYAFSDQDDYWMEDKLSSAVCALEKSRQREVPLLYCCRPKLVDAGLQELSSNIKRPPMRPSFGNALIENIVTGCTAVMNQELRALVAAELPEFTVMHDRWLYLVAACFGSVYYDETPHICYRQHETNVVGTNANRRREWKERLRLFRQKRRDISRQTEEFVRIFDKLSDRQDLKKYRERPEVLAAMQLAKELLAGRYSITKRARLAKNPAIYRQRRLDNYIFRLILFVGSY